MSKIEVLAYAGLKDLQLKVTAQADGSRRDTRKNIVSGRLATARRPDTSGDQLEPTALNWCEIESGGTARTVKGQFHRPGSGS